MSPEDVHPPSSSDAHDSNSGHKKRRVQAACDACRLRKLACNAGQPCARCINDDRPCEYMERRPREVISKARLQELESCIRLQEEIWDALVPEFPMRIARGVAETSGIQSVVDQARKALGYSDPAHAPIMTDAEFDRAQEGGPSMRTVNSPSGPSTTGTLRQRHLATSYRSPLTSVGVNNDVGQDAYEWNEDEGSDNQPTVHPAADASASRLSNASYLGLSSGATFLRAIRALAAKGNVGLLGVSDSSTSAVDQFHFESGITSPFVPVPDVHRQLPRWSEIKDHVDSFFAHFHRSLPLVHEPTIRAQLTGAMPLPTKPGSMMLVNMIIAMGASVSAQNSDRAIGHKYLRLAQAELQRDMLGKGTLPLVQGLAIMSNYLQHGNRPEDGYMCLGWACRMAVGLGLHIEPTSARLSPLDKELRIRTWWSLVCMEAGCAVTFGRPHAFSEATFSTVPLPLNIDDDDLTVSHTTASAEVEGVTQNTTLIMQARLARATCGVSDEIARNPSPQPPVLRQLEQHVVKVFEDIPATWRDWTTGPYQYQRATQVWRARDFCALLYRPVLLAAAWDGMALSQLTEDEQIAITSCRQLALDNLMDIEVLITSIAERCRAIEWYSVFFAFQSCLTLLLSVVWEPQHPSAALWRSTVLSAAAWFRTLKTMPQVGLSYASTVERILELAPTTHVAAPTVNQHQHVSSIDALYGDTEANVAAAPEINLDLSRYWTEIWGDESTAHSGFSPFMMPDFIVADDVLNFGPQQ